MKTPAPLLASFHSGAATGPVVVLVHGFLADHTYWKNLTPFLENDHSVISVDLLGFGQSPKPKTTASYSLQRQAKALYQTLADQRLIGRSFTLVGHSMGALVALQMSLLYPIQPRSLILLNMPFFKNAVEARRQIEATGRFYRVMLYKQASRPLWTLFKPMLPSFGAARRHTHSSRQGSLHAVETANSLELLKASLIPTHLVVGSCDRAVYRNNLDDSVLPDNVHIHTVPTGHHTAKQTPEWVRQLIEHAQLFPDSR